MASLIRKDNDGIVTMHLTTPSGEYPIRADDTAFVRIRMKVKSSASTYELVLSHSEWARIQSNTPVVVDE